MLKRFLLILCLLIPATVTTAEDFKVSEIQIEGNVRIATSSILAAVPIKAGDLVTMEDIDAAMQGVFSLGSFEDISAELTEVQGAKVVTFVVTELPLVRTIELVGNDELSKDKLRPLIKLRTPSLYNYEKVKESVQEIKNAYIADGYHAALIETELLTDLNNEATLKFNINEGEKILIREIRFIGNTVFDKDELLDNMETRERWFLSWLTGRGAYLEDIMEIDIERIKAAYQDKGYQDVKVKPAQVTLVENENLEVLIEIDEGAQYRVGRIGIIGDLMYPEEQLLQQVKLKAGDVFSRSVLRESILALTDLYADNGYAYANVAPLTTKNKDQLVIDLDLDVEQGTQVYVERIKIHGNTKTRDKVIRREIPILEGCQSGVTGQTLHFLLSFEHSMTFFHHEGRAGVSLQPS